MATYLDVRTATTVVQDGLVRAIQLGLGQRLPAVADLDALRTVATTGTPNRALRCVTSEGVVYRLEPFSQSAHLPPQAVKPDDRTDLGCWIRQSSRVTLGPAYFRPVHRVATGYLKTVQIFEGQSDEEVERFYGQTPSVLVESLMDEVSLSGQVQGGIYKAEWPFVLHVFSRNFRDGPEALQGSAIATEASADPGVNRIIGDLRYLLAGSRLDLDPGVKHCTIDGKASIEVADLQQRQFKASLPLTVRGSFHIVDEDLVEVSEVWIQQQMVGTGSDETFDPDNCLIRGFTVSVQAGLAAPVAPGAARIAGTLVAVQPGVWNFAASSDTYRDLLPSGEIRYTSVAVGADAPAQASGSLRLGFTRTSATDIIGDAILCDYAVDSRDPFRVL